MIYWRPQTAMRIPFHAVVLGLFSTALFALAQERTTLKREDAFQKLLAIRIFAFGGVGEAGVTSEGEKAFHAVAARTNALELFTLAATNGTDEAKMYGLCGVRKLAPDRFDRYAIPLLIGNQSVTTMAGCIVLTQKASNVVAQIRAGMYDASVAKPAK